MFRCRSLWPQHLFGSGIPVGYSSFRSSIRIAQSFTPDISSRNNSSLRRSAGTNRRRGFQPIQPLSATPIKTVLIEGRQFRAKREISLRFLPPPTPFSPFAGRRRLMILRRRCCAEFLYQKHKGHSHQHEPSQRPKTIQKSQERSLPLQQAKRLRLRMHHRIRV